MERRITKLVSSNKVKNRVYVDLDTGESFSITLNQVVELGLYSGQVLDEEAFMTLQGKAELARAKARALRALESRPLSSQQLTDRLKRKGTDEAAAEETVSWLENLGVVNDQELAGQIVRHYAVKGYGPAKIRDELYRRGIPRDYWEEALEQLPDQDDELYHQLCAQMSRRKADCRQKEKTIQALLRRGFSSEAIRRAMNQWEMEAWENESE